MLIAETSLVILHNLESFWEIGIIGVILIVSVDEEHSGLSRKGLKIFLVIFVAKLLSSAH